MGACVCSCTEGATEEKEDGNQVEQELLTVPLTDGIGESICHKIKPMKMQMNEKVPILIENDFRRLFGVSSLIQYGHFIHYSMSDIIYQYTDFINYMKSGSIIIRGLDKFCGIVISDDARYLFASTDNGWVITWDLDWHEMMRETKAHRRAILTMVYRNELLITGGQDGKIHIWDVYTMKRIRSLPIQPEPVLQIDLNDSGDQLVCCSGRHRFHLYSLETGECLNQFIGHRDGVQTARFIRSNRILSGSIDESLRLWNATTGERIRGIQRENFGRVLNLSINCDRSLVACNTGLYTRIVSYPLLIRNSQINGDVCFHPLIPHLVAVRNSNSVSICNANTGQTVKWFGRHSDHVSALCFTPDGSRLVSASHDHTIRIWDTHDLVR